MQDLKAAFEAHYHTSAERVFFAPGRVNLIGEHTDYNGGFVFPCALSFGTYLLLAKNDKQALRFCSLNMPETATIPLKELPQTKAEAPHDLPSWVNYPLGCIAQFLKQGHRFTQGYDLLYSGDVPAGAGLSSSAALEVVTAFAFNSLLQAGLSRTDLAKIGQASEHEFARVQCGIMDQFASAQGKKNHAIFLQCNTLDFELVPIELQGIKVVIANTHSPHHLDSGAYNARVAQCHTAVEQLSAVHPISCLAELTQADFDTYSHAISDPIAFRRARHVVGEVERTRMAVAALKQGDITTFGRLMNESHISLRDDYEVTGKELDTLAETAWQIEGVLGSRMTGGGFGGCIVSLVRDEAIEDFQRIVGENYTKQTGLTADFYIAEIGDGAKEICV